MFSKYISFNSFNISKKKIVNIKELHYLIKKNSNLLSSFKKNYKYSFFKDDLKKLKKFKHINIIGIGGSILGVKTIFSFLKTKQKRSYEFIDNLNNISFKKKKKKKLNIIISKSGNTLETIVNANLFIHKEDKNLIISEKKNNYLNKLAAKLKSDIYEHKNYIGGRFSVLSEVGMLPAELMGFNIKKFKQFNNLINNRVFLNNLIDNVNETIKLVKLGKKNSIILNYDEKSDNFFKWYQQLIAESLGKNGKGILPIISTMPKDNHSLMQHYLDGPKNNFFTFFYVNENLKNSVNNKYLDKDFSFLKGKNLNTILFYQKKATENVFKKKGIPFRSFSITQRNEKTLGELFTFFVLETILLAKALKVNPFDQPSVELIKTETKRIIK